MSLERDVQGHDRRSPAPDGPCIASLVRLAASARVLRRAVRGVLSGGALLHHSVRTRSQSPPQSPAKLVLCSQSLFRFADLGDDGLCRGGPDKGCGVIVSAIDVVVDRLDVVGPRW